MEWRVSNKFVQSTSGPNQELDISIYKATWTSTDSCSRECEEYFIELFNFNHICWSCLRVHSYVLDNQPNDMHFVNFTNYL